MIFIITDKSGKVAALRNDAITATYSFDFQLFEASFPLGGAEIPAGGRVIYDDPIDGQRYIHYITQVERDHADGCVSITAESLYLHDTQNGVAPYGADDDGYTMRYSKVATPLAAFLAHYIPVAWGWQLGVISPALSSGDNVTTYRVTTSGGGLNMRAAPSFDAKIIKPYSNGTIVTLIDAYSASWYQVQAPDGKIGYMHTDNLTAYTSGGSGGNVIINIEIDAGASYQEIYDELRRVYQVSVVPRVEFDGRTVTKYLDAVSSVPVFGGVRVSLATGAEALSDIVDNTAVCNVIYPISSDGQYKLDNVASETTLNQSTTPDSLRRLGRGIRNATSIAALGEERAQVVAFDDISGATQLQNAAVAYLAYNRVPTVTVEATIAELYGMGYGGESVALGDLCVAELPGCGQITAAVTALKRDLVRPDATEITLGTYRPDFVTGGDISVGGAASVSGLVSGSGSGGGIVDISINESGVLVVRYASGVTKNLGTVSGGGTTVSTDDWVYPALTTGTTSAANLGGLLRYRAAGNHVYIDGGVTIAYPGSSAVIFTLPSVCAPATPKYYLCATGGARIARVYVAANGNVALEWIKNLSNGTDYTTSTWIYTGIDFWVD